MDSRIERGEPPASSFIEMTATGRYFVVWRGRAINDHSRAIRLFDSEADAAAYLASLQSDDK